MKAAYLNAFIEDLNVHLSIKKDGAEFVRCLNIPVSMMALTTQLRGKKEEGWGRVCQVLEYTCEYDGIDDSTERQKGRRMGQGLSGA